MNNSAYENLELVIQLENWSLLIHKLREDGTPNADEARGHFSALNRFIETHRDKLSRGVTNNTDSGAICVSGHLKHALKALTEGEQILSTQEYTIQSETEIMDKLVTAIGLTCLAFASVPEINEAQTELVVM